MKISIKSSPKEIADLVLALQGQLKSLQQKEIAKTINDSFFTAFEKAIRDNVAKE